MGPEQHAMLVSIARRHYLDGVSKVDIAKERGISRYKVGRLLQTALDEGIVRIEIQARGGIDYELSEALRVKYGLRRALAAETPDEVHVHHGIGQVASALLSEIVTRDDVLGVDCGRTLASMARQLHSLERCDVVQLTGMAGVIGQTATDITRVISEVNGGRVFPIYAPYIVPDVHTAQTLRNHPAIRSAMNYYPKITKACVAIGAWTPELSQMYPLLNSADAQRLAQRGVVAETCALTVGADGQRIDAVDERRIGVSDTALKKIPDVIALAGGRGKTRAVDAVLKSGMVNSIVTDTFLAARLLGDRPD
ncbi:DNA-binding transcriptional regulator [Actinobacteria bacterium YIM 96077]|uniref:DNA-binding transcriptional regulator n=1 Tax=Phytoactinopolyspora halophila TaxID=1981511 RepID=A0A329QZX7_9ACTN|nr:sugar-binding domain-containing protein [Phytoactinopolyspora halophila]AYY11682.1 DNA-binding transcriptional regulator [Actinobacteria bacterium YIM 96077]RAW17885.1 DNA-binding transcriptional regulator [Phytoactinopolyspora halophila]